jgi:hypothetical protein
LVWVSLLESLDKDLMNLLSKFFLDFNTDWLGDFTAECLVNIFLVVVYSHLWGLKMSDVPEHFQWIIQSIQEVVELIDLVLFAHDHVKDVWNKLSSPVQESASSTLLDLFLPV